MILGEELSSFNIVNKDIYRMSDINRYNGRLLQKSENLAEHSFYVTFNTYYLGNKFNVDKDRIAKAAKIALCHDFGEMFTGDLPHNLKVISPKIKKQSEKLELASINKSFNYFYKDLKSFIEKEDEIVTTLVEAADVLDVILFIDREEQLGNKNADIIQIRYESYERYNALIMKLKELCAKKYGGKYGKVS